MKRKLVIRIKKEKLRPKPRSKPMPTKIYKDKTRYQRKPKHVKIEIEHSTSETGETAHIFSM